MRTRAAPLCAIVARDTHTRAASVWRATFDLMDSDSLIPTFLAVTGIDDESVAKQYLDITNNDLEYAVTLYMESHPPGTAEATRPDDEELAQRLQQEAYQDNVRDADASIHRHETLVDSFDGPQYPRPSLPTDIFGQGRVGIFNQRFDEELNSYAPEPRYEDEDYDLDDDYDSDEPMVVDSDGEVHDRPQSRRRANRLLRLGELTSTQQRLANLFRPPFDIMAKVDLDTAKKEGRATQKWLLVNIQDSSEFVCQVMNRDFWLNLRIKALVKANFIFLQYQHDSPNGVNYVNFYSVDRFPHLAILDPLTGERVRKWTDGEVLDIDTWLDDVDQFLTQFSLNPQSQNPVVQHEVKFDPDALTEEQQIEYALKQSLGKSADNAISLDSDDEVAAEPAEPVDPFDAIKPQEHTEPAANTTRIQIRFPNGKRVIHKFGVDERVVVLYQWLKHAIASEDYGVGAEDRFILSNGSNRSFKLIEALEQSIAEANLRNASILLEKE